MNRIVMALPERQKKLTDKYPYGVASICDFWCLEFY